MNLIKIVLLLILFILIICLSIDKIFEYINKLMKSSRRETLRTKNVSVGESTTVSVGESIREQTKNPKRRGIGLFIGIDYKWSNSPGRLSGCQADVTTLESIYKQKLVNYVNDGNEDETSDVDDSTHEGVDIYLMLEESDDLKLRPTKQNIMAHLNTIKEQTIGDPNTDYLIYIHYSGHGHRTINNDYNDKEADGMDDLLVCMKYEDSEDIPQNRPTTPVYEALLDDELSDYVKEMPSNCKMVWFFDCCHSGTMLDLPNIKNKDTIMMGQDDEQMEGAKVLCISSCREKETSMEFYGVGVLTEFLKLEHNIAWNYNLSQLIRKFNVRMQTAYFPYNFDQRMIISSLNIQLNDTVSLKSIESS